MLLYELRSMGAPEVEMDQYGYVYATIPPAGPRSELSPTLGLLAHMDTSPEAPGMGVRPIIHRNYDGSSIRFPGNKDLVLDPAMQPALLRHVGHDLITSDGTTLLGSDDKAGIAILMQLVDDLLQDAQCRRPRVRICFTIDEEIGRGVDHLDLQKFGARIAYTIDGSGTDCIFAETFNAAEATISVSGTNVHPGYAKGIMVNAVRILVSMLSELPQAEAPETTEDRQGYMHLLSMTAGSPSHASAKVILRDFSVDGLDRRKEFLEEVVNRCRRRHPAARISLDIRDEYRNMRSYIEETDVRVISFAYDAAASIGMDLSNEVVRGGTDGARLSEMGIPTPNIFNGGHDYHSCFEWNTVQNLERSLSFVKALLAYWADHGADPAKKESP